MVSFPLFENIHAKMDEIALKTKTKAKAVSFGDCVCIAIEANQTSSEQLFKAVMKVATFRNFARRIIEREGYTCSGSEII